MGKPTTPPLRRYDALEADKLTISSFVAAKEKLEPASDPPIADHAQGTRIVRESVVLPDNKQDRRSSLAEISVLYCANVIAEVW